MQNSVHVATVTWNFTLQGMSSWETVNENAAKFLQVLQNHQIQMQLNYSVLQYIKQTVS